MQIVGYTPERRLVQVELSGRAIADSGIDPWHVDVFDPQPVTLMVQGRTLHFRKLGDVAFAYATDEDPKQAWIGLHDGSRQTCVRGDLAGENTVIRFNNIVSSERPFASHFADFLDRRYKPQPKSPQGAAGAISSHELGHLIEFPVGSRLMHGHTHRISVPGSTVEQKCETSYCPVPAACLSLTGSFVTYDTQSAGYGYSQWRFAGETCRELSIVTKLSSEINWVHAALGCFQPVVVGQSLRLHLAGRKPNVVVLLVHRSMLKAVRRTVEKMKGATVMERPGARGDELDSEAIYFDRGGCKYLVWPNYFDSADSWFNNYTFHTASRLYSRGKDEVVANRITLFDLGNRLARLVVYRNHHRHVPSAEPAAESNETLESEGFSVVSVETMETQE